jgi:hypothetical protein
MPGILDIYAQFTADILRQTEPRSEIRMLPWLWGYLISRRGVMMPSMMMPSMMNLQLDTDREARYQSKLHP